MAGAQGEAAKFSVPCANAVGMLRDDAGLGEYQEDVVMAADVRALAAKIRYVVDPGNPYPNQFTGHVRVTMHNGEVREARQGHFRGGVEEPLSMADLLKKFRANCAYGGLSADRANALLDEVGALLTRPTIALHALRCT